MGEPERKKPTRDQILGQVVVELERAGVAVLVRWGAAHSDLHERAWDFRCADAETGDSFFVKVRAQRPHRKHHGQGLEREDHDRYVRLQDETRLPCLLVVLDHDDVPAAAWLSSLGPFLEETAFKPSSTVSGSVPIRYWRTEQFVPIRDAIGIWRRNGHRPPAASLFDEPDRDADNGRRFEPVPDLGRPLTVADVASALGVSAASIYGALGRGEFPHAYRVGKLWRIPESDVEAARERR
jgi:excisionase family DNA binding protein